MPDDPRINTFWLWWLLATILGFSGGTAIAVLITKEIDQALVFSGILGSFAQWLVLRNRLSKAYWWILATSLGLILGVGLGFVALVLCMLSGIGIAGMASPGIAIPGGISMVIALAVVGAVLGGVQWFVLAGQVKGARFWIVGTMLGWSIGGLIGLSVFSLSGLQNLGEIGLAIAMAVGISSTVGVITGYWLNSALTWA